MAARGWRGDRAAAADFAAVVRHGGDSLRGAERAAGAAFAGRGVAHHVWKFRGAVWIVFRHWSNCVDRVRIWVVALDVCAASDGDLDSVFSRAADDFVVDRDAAVAAVSGNAVVQALPGARRGDFPGVAGALSGGYAASTAVAAAAAERDGCGVGAERCAAPSVEGRTVGTRVCRAREVPVLLGRLNARRVRSLSVSWLVLLSLAACSAPTVPQKSDELHWLNLAGSLEDRKDWQGLAQTATERVKKYPDDEMAWSELGEAYVGIGQYEKAVEAERHALQLKQDDPHSWVNIGAAYDHLAQHDKAIDADKHAIHLKPNDEDAWLRLGTAYAGSGQHNQEADAYRHALQLKPGDERAWIALAFACDQLGQRDEAMKAYREAVRLAPSDEQAWVDLGLAYSISKQYVDATDAYQRAIKLNPNDGLAWHSLGLTYCLQGDRNSVIRTYNILRKLDPAEAGTLVKGCPRYLAGHGAP